ELFRRAADQPDALFLRKRESHDGLITGKGQPDDLTDPEFHPPADHDLVASRQLSRDSSHRADRDHEPILVSTLPCPAPVERRISGAGCAEGTRLSSLAAGGTVARPGHLIHLQQPAGGPVSRIEEAIAGRQSPRTAPSELAALQPAPAAGAVVGDDVLEDGSEGARIDGFALAHGNRTGGLVVVAGRADSLGIRDYAVVVEKYVDVVLRRQQGADVALQHEVRTVGELDGFDDLFIRGVDQIADLTADGPLPVGQGTDIGVDPWVSGIRHGGSSIVGDVAGAGRCRRFAPRAFPPRPVGASLGWDSPRAP